MGRKCGGGKAQNCTPGSQPLEVVYVSEGGREKPARDSEKRAAREPGEKLEVRYQRSQEKNVLSAGGSG